MTSVRIATRASDLAMAQSRRVAAMIEERLGVGTELLPMKTTGDLLEGPLNAVGGKGLFVKEIEEALLAGRADIAVHSAKDLPAATPEELALIAFPERADPRDALLARERGKGLRDLPAAGRVGTGSLRRSIQLRAARPDLEVVPLRGNVPTRVRKLETEDLDAVVVACAGLERLGLEERIDERLATDVMLPAVCQGILALEGRRDDPIARDVATLTARDAAIQAVAERAVLERLEADCNVPLAAFAELDGDRLRLRALLADPETGDILRTEGEGSVADPGALGLRLGEDLLASGGAALLARLRGEAAQ
ncbi:MAG: hydroxymethylbilane synthase [Myxococcota bacterium]|nr:hydroxymethylbilane synthase [Myxococcota bacterium]